jgi:ABC-2 type transport system permease protein
MNWLRVFFIGGLTSYRALFAWLNPWIYIPMLIITPLFQLLFYAYLGRTAHVESDAYFVIGDALVAASLPALWGTGGGIANERRTQTLGALLSSPASRLALFLGRGVPSIANGLLVAAFCLAASRLLLRFHPHLTTLPGLALAIVISAFSCAALGLSLGALGLRGRNVTALNNLVLAGFLILTGANVPLNRLPGWIQTLSAYLPLTHGIKAARAISAGASVHHVQRLLLTELAVGISYTMVGVLLLKLFEFESRRTASLETF